MKQEHIKIKNVEYLLWQFDSPDEREEYINYNDYEVSYMCKGENIKSELNLTDDEYLAFMKDVRNTDLDSIYCNVESFNPELALLFQI
ncbi:Uncharacterised protein [Chryseobacterium nakagawai]|uniref:Uncharacterized protein n=1 Tax=Chryseobacterium nakagawai TaxID=1241982 RepID=A0AAD0YPX6_CHRNA|nr:hypothetical protein [Chryseobacterium nakagawai]AZA91141.1 hypothetical protein EG343_11120 [Chryseobacterium nakagawai]VEH22701.1 Uncharacterised protein [Chryseobacterium nakagawai]